jgi:hypothetical protein
MKNYFLSTNHHPSTHPPWVAGQVLVNSASPFGVSTDTPAGWPWQGFGGKPFDLSCLGQHGSVDLQAIPSRRERFVPWPPLLWSARKTEEWRALFFPDLRTLKEGSTAIKREGESAGAQTSIALSSILLNWTLRSSSSVVSSSSSFSSSRCCWLSPVSAVFSQEPPTISCDF